MNYYLGLVKFSGESPTPITLINNDFAPEMKKGDSKSVFHAESEYVFEIISSPTDFVENVCKCAKNVRKDHFLKRRLTPQPKLILK